MPGRPLAPTDSKVPPTFARTEAANSRNSPYFVRRSPPLRLIFPRGNYEREDPCTSGGAIGSVACLKILNGKLYSTLAGLEYASYNEVSDEVRKRLNYEFNLARFTAVTLQFCTQRKGRGGEGGCGKCLGSGVPIGANERQNYPVP